MMSVWQLALRIAAIVGSVGLVILLAGAGVLWLVRRARTNRHRSSERDS
jgi:hypothetical protein